MAIFQVTPLGNSVGAIANALANADPKLDFYKLAANAWLVSFSGTSKELAQIIKLEPPNELNETCLIVRFNAYYGVADKDVWEWIDSRGGR